jgi:hypothetical protein
VEGRDSGEVIFLQCVLSIARGEEKAVIGSGKVVVGKL